MNLNVPESWAAGMAYKLAQVPLTNGQRLNLLQTLNSALTTVTSSSTSVSARTVLRKHENSGRRLSRPTTKAMTGDAVPEWLLSISESEMDFMVAYLMSVARFSGSMERMMSYIRSAMRRRRSSYSPMRSLQSS